MTWILGLFVAALMHCVVGERNEAVKTEAKMEGATKTLVDNLIAELAQLHRENAELSMRAEHLATELRRLSPPERPLPPEETVSLPGSEIQIHEVPVVASEAEEKHEVNSLLGLAKPMTQMADEIRGAGYDSRPYPLQICGENHRYEGANKKCCMVGNADYQDADVKVGLCYSRQTSSEIVSSAPDKKCVSTGENGDYAPYKSLWGEIKRLKEYTRLVSGCPNSRAVRTSDSPFALRTNDGSKKCWGAFFIEWMDTATFIHPASASDIKSKFLAAVPASAKLATAETLCCIRAALKSGTKYKKITDFQGFVTGDGQFIAADLGEIKEGSDDTYKSQYIAMGETATALGGSC